MFRVDVDAPSQKPTRVPLNIKALNFNRFKVLKPSSSATPSCSLLVTCEHVYLDLYSEVWRRLTAALIPTVPKSCLDTCIQAQRPIRNTHTFTTMAGRGGGGNRGKVLLPPINFIFRLLQQQIPCSIWLYEQLSLRIEGKIRVSRRISIRVRRGLFMLTVR